jgi:sugar phosphate isomerase/epimerase
MENCMLAMTTDFHGVSKNTGELRETLVKINQAGFSHVHWCHEWTGDYIYSHYEMLQIREWLYELGLKVKGIHATDGIRRQEFNPRDPRDLFIQNTKNFASENEYNRLAGVELIKNRVDLAHIIDAGAIVLHFDQPYEVFKADPSYRDRYYRQAFKTFDELEYYCKLRHIRLCLENCNLPPEYTYYQFDTLFERYDADYMGLCFDTGHGNIACKYNCLDYAERYKERLFIIHIHDNHGEKDEHIIPFDGTFNWEGFAEILASSPYEFPILMEPSLKDDSDEKTWLARAFAAGSRLHQMVMKNRNL